ncbi:MAG: hypothetical protein Q8L90_08465 [Bacteroidota bacterium]|nr:hypothetical protein [Bacteroidota bacterium]
MMTNKLIIEVVVGYMLKVLKSGNEISKYNDEFKAIRHGDYFAFINFVKSPLPEKVVYNNGAIIVNGKHKKDDSDFLALINSGPSLKLFYRNCIAEYGKIIDADLIDETFEKCARFEIALRMHANNHNLLNEREDLIEVIKKLCEKLNIPDVDICKLQKGRDFLNMVKLHKQKFSSWEEGMIKFNIAIDILKKYNLTIF